MTSQTLTSKDKKILRNNSLSIDEKMKSGLFYDEYKKFGIGDVTSTGKVLTVETNWNESVLKNKYLRLRVGDKSIVVLNEHLRSILKIVAPLEEWEELATHSKRYYQERKKRIKFQARQDYRRGDWVLADVYVPEAIVMK